MFDFFYDGWDIELEIELNPWKEVLGNLYLN